MRTMGSITHVTNSDMSKKESTRLKSLVDRFARIDSCFEKEKGFFVRIDLPKKWDSSDDWTRISNFNFNSNRRPDAIRTNLAKCFKNRYLSGAQQEPQSQKIARTASNNFLNNSRALPNKTSVLRQIAPESSPKSSAKSLSQKLFGVPFLSLMFFCETLVCESPAH